MCLSKVSSATSCFSLRFSSSKSRNRRSSLTPIPPYLLFQLYNVCSLIPFSRQISLAFTPASACFKAYTILSWFTLFGISFFPYFTPQSCQKTKLFTVQFYGRTSYPTNSIWIGKGQDDSRNILRGALLLGEST